MSFASILNCDVMNLPFTYLGTTMGAPKTVYFWKRTVDKIKHRLEKWKGKLLSLRRRIFILKSILTIVPLLYVFFFKC